MPYHVKQEDLDFRKEVLQELYQHLNISSEQAGKIAAFEEDVRNFPIDHLLTQWEEFDFELDAFKTILDDNQFQEFIEQQKKSRHQYEINLKELDDSKQDEIEMNLKLLSYLKTVFRPNLQKKLEPFAYLLAKTETEKVSFLVSELHRYQRSQYSLLVSSHYRHHRTLMPNSLKLELVRNEISNLWPDYRSFKQSLDRPTLCIADCVYEKLAGFQKSAISILEEELSLYGHFFSEATEEYFSKTNRGWTFSFDLPDNGISQEEASIMTYVLSLSGRYGI